MTKLDVYFTMKNNNKLNFASDKTYKKQIELYFIRKDLGPNLNTTG